MSLGLALVNNQTVNAATMRTAKKSYAYNSKGHKTKACISKNKKIKITRTKKY